jgi:hypothetical protein
MKNFTTLVSTLLLTLTLFCVNATAQTLGMYDVPITATPIDGGGWKFTFDERPVVIHRKVRFVLTFNTNTPPDAGLQNWGIRIKPDVSSTTVINVGVTSPATFTYTTAGEKDIRITYVRFQQGTPSSWVDTDFFLKLTVREVQAPYQKPDETWKVTTTEDFSPPCINSAYPNTNERPQKGFASVYIKYGAGHNNKLVRPFIFVDGIDFDPTTYTDPDNNNEIVRHGDTGWDVLTMGADDGKLDILPGNQEDYDAFKEYPIAFQKLVTASQANGGDSYDIMFVDFSSGADYIQRNSLLLQEVLRQVNQKKVANAQGRINKNVVLGASMGGLVVRHALTSMERRGESHCTHTYVSFDAPQKGANIPLSIQAMGWFLNKSLDIPAAQRFWKNLSMPAARQLLIKHFGDFAQNGGASVELFNWSENFNTSISGDYACLRAEFVQDMNDLGYPKDARNIAISCGSTLGNALANQGFQAGSELFDADVHVGSRRFGQVQLYASGSSSTWSPQSGNDHYVKRRCHPDANFTDLDITDVNHSNVLFAGALPISTDAFFKHFLPDGTRTPCKYNGIVVRNTFLTGLNMDHVQGCKRNDFATIKRLLQGFATDNGTDLSLDGTTYQRSFCFMPTMSTLDINWDMTQANLEKEIDLDAIVRNNLTPFAKVYAPNGQRDGGKNLKHVEISQSMVTWLQTEMQIGETAGGAAIVLPLGLTRQLVFSKDGVISRNASVNQYGTISLNGDPSVKVGLGGCGSVKVDINNGGKFDIGSASTVGQVTINANSVVKIGNGGALNLATSSQLIIENGGKLIIEAGANINLTGGNSKVFVKKGGELVINDNFNFSGDGHFEFDQGHKFTANADLNLTGSGNTSKFFVLNDAPAGTENKLKITGHTFCLSNALVYYGANSEIEITNSNTSLINTFTNVFFTGSTALTGKAVTLKNAANVNFSSCNFDKLQQGVKIEGGLINGDAFFSGCTFYGVNNCIDVKNVEYVRMPGCNFNYDPFFDMSDFGTACKFENVTFNVENNCIFKGFAANGSWKNYKAIELINATMNNASSLKISDFKTGIEASMGSSVLLWENTEISDCETGINFTGSTGGTEKIVLNCTKLVNNMTGIKGTNVKFNGPDGKYIGSGNEFANAQNPNSLLFDISYPVGPTGSIISGNINANNNYWPDGFMNTRFNMSLGQCSGCPFSQRLSLELCSESTGLCAGNWVQDCCGQRVLTYDGSWDFNMYWKNCARGGGGDDGTSDALKVQKPTNPTATKAEKDKLTIYPNPANETVKLDIEDGNYTLKVLNTVGQTIFEQNTEGSLSVNTATWTNGIYLFEVTNKTTNKQQRSKIVVQH